jgi:hypothetical protein
MNWRNTRDKVERVLDIGQLEQQIKQQIDHEGTPTNPMIMPIGVRVSSDCKLWWLAADRNGRSAAARGREQIVHQVFF